LSGEPEKLASYLAQTTPLGLPSNVWGIGPALLWAPFFLAAHGTMLLLSLFGLPVSPDGYGMPYQVAVLTGSILYGGLGLLMICRAYRLVAGDGPAVAWCVVTVAAAGNAIYYLIVEPHMSHAVSLFAVGLFVLIWMRGRDSGGWKWAAILGASAGLLALIRPQEGLFLLLPYLDRGWTILRDSRGGSNHVAPRIRRLLLELCLSGLVAFAFFLPQLLVWNQLWGTFLQNPYELSGQRFYWLQPKGLSVLLSAHRGLFVWNPIFLFAVAGLVFLVKREPALAVTALLGICTQWYLIASWHAWDQGKSFGGRMFIGCTPFFVLGILALWSWARDRGLERVAVAIACLLVAANCLLMVAYVSSWYAS
jgi:hypothetical protein